jgi:hypothetical protein
MIDNQALRELEDLSNPMWETILHAYRNAHSKTYAIANAKVVNSHQEANEQSLTNSRIFASQDLINQLIINRTKLIASIDNA